MGLLRLQETIRKQETRCSMFQSVLGSLLQDVERAQGYDVAPATEVAAFETAPLLKNYQEKRAEFLERSYQMAQMNVAPDPDVIDATKTSLRDFLVANKGTEALSAMDGPQLLEKFWARIQRAEQEDVLKDVEVVMNEQMAK